MMETRRQTIYNTVRHTNFKKTTNLSFVWGKLFPQNTQYTIQNNTIYKIRFYHRKSAKSSQNLHMPWALWNLRLRVLLNFQMPGTV